MCCEEDSGTRLSDKESRRYYTHDLKKLLEAVSFIGFQHDLKSDSTLAVNWDLVTRWNEESRYQPRGAEAEVLAKNMLLAISEEDHGVLQCLSKYW